MKIVNLMKKLFVFLTAFLVLGSNLAVVQAAAPSTVRVNKSLISTVGGRKEAKFVTADGKYGYCITPNKSGAPSGTTFRLAGTYNNPGVLYLLENKNQSSNDGYFGVGLAIWKYNNNYLPQTYLNNPNSSYTRNANSYASEAASHKNYAVQKPEIKANITSGKLTISSDKKYYQSPALYATLKVQSKYSSNATYTVSVSGVSGAYIVNASGSKQTSYKSGAKFYVRVPATSVTKNATLTVKYSFTGQYDVARKYVATSGDWQELVIVYPEPKTVTTKTTLTVTPVKRVCEKFNDKYYGTDGKEVTEIEYKQQCFTHKCEKVGDKYYGKDGKETTETGYKQQCFTHKCEKVGDKYYGKDGKETTEAGYKQQCFSHSCEKVGDKYYDKEGKETTEAGYMKACFSCTIKDGKYYDKEGRETTETGYQQACFKHICEKVGDKYYDKEGKETTKANYKKVCFEHKCEEVDGTYYDKEGNEVSEEEYKKVCFTHICEKVDDTYYGKDGKEVSESQYNKECNEHKCEKVDDTYFDKDGNEVTEIEYQLSCFKHVCEKVGDKYFGNDGREVSKATYNKECVEVPDTGVDAPEKVFAAVAGIFMIGLGSGLVLYTNRKNS